MADLAATGRDHPGPMNNPRLLLADEPTDNLNSTHGTEAFGLLPGLRDQTRSDHRRRHHHTPDVLG